MKKILTRTGQGLLVILAIPVILYGMVFTLSIANAAQPDDVGQEVCPEGNGWTDHINVNALTYTYTVPGDKEVVESCYKAGTTLVSGVSNVVASNVWNKDGCPEANGCNYQNISHASFLLRDKKQDNPKICPEGTVNIGTEQEPICRDEPTGCPYGDSIPIDSPKCAPSEVENTTPTPVETQETEVFQGK